MLLLTFTYCPFCRRQLGQQQTPSIAHGPEPASSRCPMTVPWLLPLPPLSFSTVVRVSCVPLASIERLLEGWHFAEYVNLKSHFFLALFNRPEDPCTLPWCGRKITCKGRFLSCASILTRRARWKEHSFYITLILCSLYCCDFQTGFNILKAFLALPNLSIISLLAPPSAVTLLPKYLN